MKSKNFDSLNQINEIKSKNYKNDWFPAFCLSGSFYLHPNLKDSDAVYTFLLTPFQT